MKKFMKIAFVAAFVAVAEYSVYASQKSDIMSDLALANVEALAWDEIIVGQPCACVKIATACIIILGNNGRKMVHFMHN